MATKEKELAKQPAAVPVDRPLNPKIDPDEELDSLRRQTLTLQAEAAAHRLNAKDHEQGPKAYRDKANAELAKAAECDQKKLELQEEMRHIERGAGDLRLLRASRARADAEAKEEKEAARSLEEEHKLDLGEYEERKVKVYVKDKRGPHRLHADTITDFDKIDAVVVPKDTQYSTDDKHASEPDWNKGWYLQDRKTGLVVEGWNVDGGPPPLALRVAWREGMAIRGLLLFRDLSRHN